MILREVKWILVSLLYLTTLLTAQTADDRSYDTNDWIPITPSSKEQLEVEPKRATGRVLNLDAPAQKFFPDDYNRKKRPAVQQYLRETSYSKPHIPLRHRPKHTGPYKFENIGFNNQKYHQQQGPPLQYFTNKEVKLPTVEQPPPLPPPAKLIAQYEIPAPNAPNLYQQYNIPNATNVYQGLQPTAINQELLGAIQNQPPPPQPQDPEEQVQLLYVPLENLKPNQPITQGSQTIYQQAEAPRQEKQVAFPPPPNLNKQHRLANIEQDFIQQALQAVKLQHDIQLGAPIVYQTTTTTTPKPRKRKPHQPPLAVYMGGDQGADVNDVLNVLKDAKNISVQDSVQPDSPKIFIGPSTLDPPNGYTKFPLPYLNSIEGNRIERKIDQLPFFVAPLSYKTPPGYSKIPLPSPHVGSVVVSNKEELHEKHPILRQHAESENHNQYEVLQKPYRPKTTTENLVSQYELNGQGFELDPNGFQQQYNVAQYQVPQRPELLQFNQQAYNLQEKHQEIPQQQVFREEAEIRQKPQQFPQENFREETDLRQQPQLVPQQVFREAPQAPQEIPQQVFREEAEIRQKPQQTFREESDLRQQKDPLKQILRGETEIRERPQQVFKEETDLSVQKIPRDETEIRQKPQQILREEPEIRQKPQQVFRETYIEEPVRQPQAYNEQVKPQAYNLEDVRQKPQQILQYQQPISQAEVTQAPSEDLTGKFKGPRQELQYKYSLPPSVNSQDYYQGTNKNPDNVNPLELAINQFELQQINSQLEPNKPKTEPQQVFQQYDETTPRGVLKEAYEEPVQTTQKSVRNKQLRRGKPTRQPTVRTTEDNNSKYTVLEEFSVRTETTTPLYEQQFEEIKTPSSVPKYANTKTEVEIIPANIYKLGTTTPGYEQQENVYKLPQYSENRPTNQHLLNQELMDKEILSGQTAPAQQQSIPQHFSEDFQIKPLVHNRGNQDAAKARPPPLTINPQNFANIQTQDEYSPPIPPKTKELIPVLDTLQEQAVRPLLVPNLLVPTTEEQQQSTVKYETPSTLTTEPIQVETTTTRLRTRGRQRGNHNRYTAQVSTTRRSVSRRRPLPTRTTTVRPSTTSYYSDPEHNSRRTVSVASAKQRFRTRGRPVHNAITERVGQTTTENDVKLDGFHAAHLTSEPNSYMQFDHVIDEQKIITIQPEHEEKSALKDYHQVYSLPSEQHTPKPVVDVQITHPIVEPAVKDPVIISKPTPEAQFVRFSSNVQSGGVLHNNEGTTTARSSVRLRGRTRGRSRFATTTTSRPTTRLTTSTTTTEKEQVKAEEPEEFYGFIRSPDFSKPQVETRPPTEEPIQVYSASYQSEELSTQPQRVVSSTTPILATPVHFVGEIRPKYQTSTVQYDDATAAQTTEQETKPKPRGRIRVPPRKPQESIRQSYNDVSGPGVSDQATRRSSVLRTRGRTHFRVPDNLKQKVQVETEENQNYPASFFKNRETTTAKPTTFQITVGPNLEEDFEEDDQQPHPSLYQPKIVAKPNDIPVEDKEPIALPVVATREEPKDVEAMEKLLTDISSLGEEAAETTTVEAVTKKSKGRRRGVWKLIKQRPVDQFETAESQNYQSVINSFDEIEKVPQEKLKSSSEDNGGIFDTLYEMFGITEKTPEDPTTTPPAEPTIITTTILPTFPEELTEIPTTDPIIETQPTNKTEVVPETTVKPLEETTTVTPASKLDVTRSTFDVEPWEMHVVKTSTSTEVSHETEICYKGRCVKSRDRKIRSEIRS